MALLVLSIVAALVTTGTGAPVAFMQKRPSLADQEVSKMRTEEEIGVHEELQKNTGANEERLDWDDDGSDGDEEALNRREEEEYSLLQKPRSRQQIIMGSGRHHRRGGSSAITKRPRRSARSPRRARHWRPSLVAMKQKALEKKVMEETAADRPRHNRHLPRKSTRGRRGGNTTPRQRAAWRPRSSLVAMKQEKPRSRQQIIMGSGRHHRRGGSSAITKRPHHSKRSPRRARHWRPSLVAMKQKALEEKVMEEKAVEQDKAMEEKGAADRPRHNRHLPRKSTRGRRGGNTTPRQRAAWRPSLVAVKKEDHPHHNRHLPRKSTRGRRGGNTTPRQRAAWRPRS